MPVTEYISRTCASGVWTGVYLGVQEVGKWPGILVHQGCLRCSLGSGRLFCASLTARGRLFCSFFRLSGSSLCASPLPSLQPLREASLYSISPSLRALNEGSVCIIPSSLAQGGFFANYSPLGSGKPLRIIPLPFRLLGRVICAELLFNRLSERRLCASFPTIRL